MTAGSACGNNKIKKAKVTTMKKEKAKLHPGWHLSKKERFSYYVGDMGRQAAMSVLSIFMTTFLLLQGINPLAVAGITAVIKFIDAFDDVIFGYLVDRIKITEWKLTKKLAGEGKYLPWYRLTFFTFPLAIILFYLMPKGMSDGGKLVWYAVTYLLYDLTCTLSEVPMNSMIMTLTDNVDERNSILKDKVIFSTIFALIIGVGLPMLISEYVGLPVSSVAIVSAVICFFFMLPLATSVKEYNSGLKNVEGGEEKKYTFRDMLRCVKTNKYMAIYLLYVIVYTIGGAGGAAGLFVSYYLFHSSMVTTLAVPIALIPGLLMQVFSDKIQKKFGRRNTLMYITLFMSLALFITYFCGYDNIALIIVLAALGGVFNFPRGVVLRFLIPDTIEYARYKTGEDCSGIFYALNSFVEKAMNGLVSSLGLALLGLFGFVAVNAASFADLEGVVQPQSAMDGMWFLYSLFPAICYLLSAFVLLLYKLKDKDAQLMAKCNSGEITREECEAQLSRKY